MNLQLKSPALISLIALCFLCTPAKAQLKGENGLGDVGLQAGTISDPSLEISIPLYLYNTSRLIGGNGELIAKNFNYNMFYTGIGGSLVTKKKILNANWGASILIPFTRNRIDANSINLNSSSSLRFTDIYIQPVQLGWHLKQVDFLAGYALYLPTGKYTPGGSDNTGMGMWTNEFSAGTTIFLDDKKLWNLSTLAMYDIQSRKKDTNIRPGNILSLKGGAGKTFYEIFNAGLVYGMQFKITKDELPASLDLKKDHVYALGLEASVYIPFSSTSIGFRWENEFGAQNRFQGNNFFINIAQVIKSYE